ncbi:hypothetical protein DF186_15720 [Enterococcus hirae]|nr:hypothetical protein DF186_15720 [Enterococcus hirae]
MLRVIDYFLGRAQQSLDEGVDPDSLLALSITRHIQRMGDDITGGKPEEFDLLLHEIDAAFSRLTPAAQQQGT